METCHILLGKSWQNERRAIYDGHKNRYSFKYKRGKIHLVSMTPHEIQEDQLIVKQRVRQFVSESLNSLPPKEKILAIDKETPMSLTNVAPELPSPSKHSSHLQDHKDTTEGPKELSTTLNYLEVMRRKASSSSRHAETEKHHMCDKLKQIPKVLTVQKENMPSKELITIHSNSAKAGEMKQTLLSKPHVRKFVYRETLLSFTNLAPVLPSEISCNFQDFRSVVQKEESRDLLLPVRDTERPELHSQIHIQGEALALLKTSSMDAGSVNNTLMIKERIFPLIRRKEHQIVFDPGSLFEIFPHDIRNKQGKEIIVVDAIIPRYAILSIFNDNLLDMFQSSEKFILGQFFKRKGFLFDKHETWYPCYFLINSVLMSIDKFTTAATTSNDAELFFGEIVYHDSCLNFNKHLGDHAEQVNFILDDLSNKMFAETEKFAFDVFDLVFQVIVVKAQGIQDKEMSFHAPKIWLYHVWLKKNVVLERMKHLRKEQQANKKQCRMIFKPGENLLIQMKRGRLPIQMKTKLMPRSFQDETDLRSNPSQVGENDEILTSSMFEEAKEMEEQLEPELKEAKEEATKQHELEEANDKDLHVPLGPMTRSKQARFHQAFYTLLHHIQGRLECANPVTLIVIHAT